MDVVFEDEQILVVNKPAGLVVNRSETIKEGTLQDELGDYFHLGADLGIGGRAGIVHRLDRETSGLLLVAKTQGTFENLQVQFKTRLVEKEYIVLVHGLIHDQSGSVESKIARIGKFGKFGIVSGRPPFALQSRASGGREARTDFEVEERYNFSEANFTRLILARNSQQGSTLTKSRLDYLKRQARDYTMLKVFPKTGRTHQVRVHLKSIGHSVVSDAIYTPSKLIKFDLLWCPRLFLHASSLEFTHPRTKARVKFKSDLPGDLKLALAALTINH